MSGKTAIAWTDATFNIAWGCEKFSPGCKHCYAETWAHRYGFDVWGGDKGRRTFGPKHWNEPLKWNRDAEKAGIRRKVFTSSMCDIGEEHPTIAVETAKLWPLTRETPWLDWQVLTKRAERFAEFLPADWEERDAYTNVWLGVSVESGAYYDRIARLREVPCIGRGVRFVSFEPLLGFVAGTSLAGIDWAIFGGESGSGARPCDPSWIRAGMATCRYYGTKVFVKQMGSNLHPDDFAPHVILDRKGADPAEWPEDLRVREFPA